MQLLIDGFEADWAKLQAPHLINSTLADLPRLAGFTETGRPATTEYGDVTTPNDWTFAGALLLPRSRYIIHTWPARGWFWFDSFISVDFEPLPMVLYLHDAFDAKRLHWRTVDRGEDTNPDIREAHIGHSAEWKTLNGIPGRAPARRV